MPNDSGINCNIGIAYHPRLCWSCPSGCVVWSQGRVADRSALDGLCGNPRSRYSRGQGAWHICCYHSRAYLVSPRDITFFSICLDIVPPRHLSRYQAALVLRALAHALPDVLSRNYLPRSYRCIRRDQWCCVACPVQRCTLPASDCRDLLHQFPAILHAGPGFYAAAGNAVDLVSFQCAVRAHSTGSRSSPPAGRFLIYEM